MDAAPGMLHRLLHECQHAASHGAKLRIRSQFRHTPVPEKAGAGAAEAPATGAWIRRCLNH
jgi:hypothetical protein